MPRESWAIYCRISKARRSNGKLETLGVDRQEPPTRALIERLGGEVFEVYTDNDTSAYSKKARPSYQRMLADATAGLLQGIAAWDADRLTRQPIENEALIDLAEQHGIKLATVTGEYDLATPSGRLHFRILGAIARHESEHKAERMVLMHKAKAEKGEPAGGKRPFGFEADRQTVNAPEAKLLQEAAARVLSGESLSQICHSWASRGVLTPAGGQWRHKTLGPTLRLPRLAGIREHNGVSYPAAWPAILDLQTWAAVKATLDARATPGRMPVRTFVLSGLLRCGLCGAAARGTSRGSKTLPRAYVCSTCYKVSRAAEPIEAYVANQALDVLDSQAVMRLLLRRQGRQENLQVTSEHFKEDRERLDGLLVSGLLSKAEYQKKLQLLTQRIEAVTDQLPSPARRVFGLPVGMTVGSWWREASVEERRQALGLVVESIDLHPVGRGRHPFDGDKELAITWQEAIPVALIAALVRR